MLATVTTCFVAAVPDWAVAQNIVVSGGAVQSNSTPTTYDSIEVYGTDGSSNPSTYNADGSLTLTGYLSAYLLGVFNVNGDVTVSGSADASSSGVIGLNSGTLSAQQLSFGGTGAVTQAGGHYATGTLTLSGSAALTYGTDDSITDSTSLTSGASLTLTKDLALTGPLSISDGASIARTTETVSASCFNVSNATLDLRAGDTFSSYFYEYNSVTNGGVVNAATGTALESMDVSGVNGSSAPATFNVNGDVTLASYADAYSGGVINLNAGTLSGDLIYIEQTGSLNQAGGNYAVNYLYLDSGAINYGTGDSITTDLGLDYGSSLTLAKDLSLTGRLMIYDNATALVAAGHNYSASGLRLGLGAAFTYGAGGTITDEVRLYSGANLTLAKDLVLTDRIAVYGGSSIARTTETISASYFEVINATLDLRAGDTFDPDSTNFVSSGGVVNAAAGSAFGSLDVSGVNSSSDPSMFNVNGDVILTSSAHAYSGGVINLNAGTLSAQSLSFDRADAVTRSDGNYATGSLYLSYGAALTYGSGDSIADDVTLYDGASLTLAKDLSLAGGLTITGSGNSLVTAGHNYSVNTLTLHNNAALTYGSGDSITDSASLDGGSSLTLAKDLALTGGLSIVGNSLVTAGHNYSASSLSLVYDAALTYGTGDSITDDVSLYYGASLTLAKDLTLAGGLSLDGATTALVIAGHNYSASGLMLRDGSALTYGTGDSITSSAYILSGSTLTLTQNLALTDSILLADGGSIARNTETISASYFGVSNATLDLRAGDTFGAESTNFISYGGVVNAAAGTAFDSVEVYGVNYFSSAPSTFNVNGDVPLAGSAQAYAGGIINLNAGTLSAGSLSFDGEGAVTQAGGHYATDSLSLANGVALTFVAGDSVSSLSIDGVGSLLDELAPLSLTALSLTSGGTLHLSAFTGTGAVANWGLKLAGDDRTFLENLIAAGLITDGMSPLLVIYDAGLNATFVTSTSVPEIHPNTAHSALAILMGACCLIERRRRPRGSCVPRR